MINNKTVFVGLVDDDKVFQFITAKVLKSLNIIDRLFQFENGQELLEYLIKNSNNSEEIPDVIFLDIQMPFMDGWQFLKEYSSLKINLPKKICFYILSSSISLFDKQQVKLFPIVKDYLVKPIDREDYIKILESIYN
jgi:CheY-like chemotaxis protein